MHKIFHSIAKIIVNDSDIGKNSDLWIETCNFN